MVVGDLDLIGIRILPEETDAPLVVDSNTVLTGSVAFEVLESVGWWNLQRLQLPCCSKHFQFACRKSLDVTGKPTGELPVVDPFRFPALE
jgi:hypothetical protein